MLNILRIMSALYLMLFHAYYVLNYTGIIGTSVLCISYSCIIASLLFIITKCWWDKTWDIMVCNSPKIFSCKSCAIAKYLGIQLININQHFSSFLDCFLESTLTLIMCYTLKYLLNNYISTTFMQPIILNIMPAQQPQT